MRGKDEGARSAGVKRRWNDNIVLRNQGSGTEASLSRKPLAMSRSEDSKV